MIKRYLTYLGFEVSSDGYKYTGRCNAMLGCSVLYYFISIASVRGDGFAWLIILLLNIICFLKIILANTINIGIINNNIASQPLSSDKDKGKLFYIIKSAIEIGIFFVYSICFIWVMAQFLVQFFKPSSVTDFPADSGLVKLLAIILYIVLLYEDAENIFLTKYCSADSVDAKNTFRKEVEQ